MSKIIEDDFDHVPPLSFHMKCVVMCVIVCMRVCV